MRTFLTFGMCLLIFFSLATRGFGGAPFESGGCTASLIWHEAYTDTSSWKFQGSCTNPDMNYTVFAVWKGDTRKALESLEDTNNHKGSLISDCTAGDPWLNELTCTLSAIQGDIFNYYGIYNVTRYPLTGGALSSAQKAQFHAEALANGPKPSSQVPPPPPPPSKQISKLKVPIKESMAIAQIVPTILSPTQGQEFSWKNPIKIQVKFPQGMTESKAKLYFEYKEPQGWVVKNVIPEYDVKANPNGINVDYSKFGKKGDWKMKARFASPATAKWTNPVEFKIK